MSPKLDLTGQRFGMLVAVRPTEKRNGHCSVMWECMCDCGKTTLAPSDWLKSGHKTSCGCKRADSRRRRITTDLSDMQKEIIMAMADCSLRISEVAQKVYTCGDNVRRHIKQIEQKTGKNPRCFYDLIELVEMVKGE